MKTRISFLAILVAFFCVIGCSKTADNPQPSIEIEEPEIIEEVEEEIEEEGENEDAEEEIEGEGENEDVEDETEEEVQIDLPTDIIGTYIGMFTYRDYTIYNEDGPPLDVRDTIFRATYTIEDVYFIPPTQSGGINCDERGVIKVIGFYDTLDGKKKEISSFCHNIPARNFMESRDSQGFSHRTQWGIEINREEKTVRYYSHFGYSGEDFIYQDGFYTKVE